MFLGLFLAADFNVTGRQEDAQEFLNCLLNIIAETLQKEEKERRKESSGRDSRDKDVGSSASKSQPCRPSRYKLTNAPR